MSELPPTPARRREARSRGEVAVSSLLVAAGGLGGAGLAVSATAPRMFEAMSRLATATIGVESPESLPWRAALAWCLLPALGGALAGAAAVGVVQTRALFTFGALGWRRETAPSLWLGLLLGGGVVVLSLLAMRALVAALLVAPPHLDAIVAAFSSTAASYAPRLLLLVVAVGLAELGRRRTRLERALSMNRSERRAERRRR